MPEHSCCFTGYRPEKFPFPLDVRQKETVRFENKLTDAIFSLPGEEVTRFYCGMAMGFDIIAAETVLLLRDTIKDCSIDLICVIPFEGQADTFPADWRERYDRVLAAADEVIVLSKAYYRGCYAKRNQFMVDHSRIVLTYFDGQSGGTRNTLIYAKKKGKQIVNLSETGVHETLPLDEYYDIVEDDG